MHLNLPTGIYSNGVHGGMPATPETIAAAGIGRDMIRPDVYASVAYQRTRERLIATGRELVQTHGAHVVVMGCAGMAQYRRELEDAIGVPVVEPTQAAAGMALARVRLRGS